MDYDADAARLHAMCLVCLRLTAPVIGVCPTAQLRCAFALGVDGCTGQ